MTLLGWLGSICLALCALPQVLKTIREGNADGLSTGFLTLWALGEVFCLIYVIEARDYALIFNYTINTAFVGFLFGAKVFK